MSRFGFILKDIFYYAPRNILTKIFSKYHFSGPEVWNMSETVARQIVRHLKAFREGPFSGYPQEFMTWEEMKEAWSEIDESQRDRFLGGGVDGWRAAVDEMIFGFEYILYSDVDPQYVKDKHALRFINEHGPVWTSVGYNRELANALDERARLGRHLFAKFIGNLWD